MSHIGVDKGKNGQKFQTIFVPRPKSVHPVTVLQELQVFFQDVNDTPRSKVIPNPLYPPNIEHKKEAGCNERRVPSKVPNPGCVEPPFVSWPWSFFWHSDLERYQEAGWAKRDSRVLFFICREGETMRTDIFYWDGGYFGPWDWVLGNRWWWWFWLRHSDSGEFRSGAFWTKVNLFLVCESQIVCWTF